MFYGLFTFQGPAVETEKCGSSSYLSWECLYGAHIELPADRQEVVEEIGPGCRCGCIIHLGVVKPRRLIASSSESCPGRTFWLVQADEGFQIKFTMDFFRLPCNTQWLKIRDGDSLASDLILEYIGGTANNPKEILSTKPQMLLEFYSSERLTKDDSCEGGFLGHAQQICMFDKKKLFRIFTI